MVKIVLKRANVVKQVDSEERAAALEEKGFLREGAVPKAPPGEEKRTEALKQELTEIRKQLAAANKEIERLQQELKGTTKQLAAANKEIEKLQQELKGTTEQLEAALKQNREVAAQK